jgi:hypothetical protein
MNTVAKVKTTAKPGAGAGDDIGWRQFPTFEQLLGSETPSPLFAKVEKTCRQLNDIIQSGAAADKSRAQSAMTAYGRSLDLLRQLSEMRDKQAAGAEVATSTTTTR